MSPRFLIGVFDSVYLVALCARVGSVLFFSFAVAPMVFTVLGKGNRKQVRAGPVAALLRVGAIRRSDRAAGLRG